MPAYTWISLAFFVVALLVGSIWVAVNLVRALRDGRPALRRLNEASASLNGRSSELERRMTTLQPKVAQLQRERARLSRAVAQMQVLLGATSDARKAYRVARFFR